MRSIWDIHCIVWTKQIMKDRDVLTDKRLLNSRVGEIDKNRFGTEWEE